LELFYLDSGRYPTEAEGLKALSQKPDTMSSWGGPYLDKEVPRDPWGNNYVYKIPGEKTPFDIICYGADKAPGGEGENQDIKK
jgi:general secretion pathway protein G